MIVALQMLLLVVQISVLISGIVKNKDLLSYGYGFAIWGCLPNAVLAMINVLVK